MSGSPNLPTQWLLDSPEPWTRYRTLVDLLGCPESSTEVLAARAAMLDHPRVQSLVAGLDGWPEGPIKRHNDASHAIHKLAVLADFGFRAGDPGIDTVTGAILGRQSPEGAFQSLLNIAQAFGGSGEDQWIWILCDAPVLLYALLSMGFGGEPRVQRAVEHLVGLVEQNGWRCRGAPEIGKFHGPGRRSDPCPIANLLALKAISQVESLLDSPAAHLGAEMILGHWQNQGERKFYMFGIGTDFRKLKYPFIWYDILHVVAVLSRFPWLKTDPRLLEMTAMIADKAGEQGLFTPESVYKAWCDWDFGQKRTPSSWITFLAHHTLILSRS
ncbi:MAG: hypothetical protein EHM70_13890 [Chloroflexota bacterium]|nr:MAG: hypothetical protein EHM70_13890 [Chloroflexota bacterium]